MESIFFYTEKKTPRLEWILAEVLSKTGCKISFSYDKNNFQNQNGIKINYSEKPIAEKEIHIVPQGILFENKIIAQEDLEQLIRDTFKNLEKNQDFSPTTDIFSIAFYLLSRYEEYLPFEPDAHDRFAAKRSLAYRAGFLQRPLVDELRLILQEKIKMVFPDFNFEKIPFRNIATYDIDQAFSYKNKGFWRTTFAFLKDILNKKRWAVLFQNARDPFDTFAELDAFHHEKRLTPTYFFLLGDWAKFDKNIHFQNTDFQQIINKIASKYTIGIHPSYRSNFSPFLIKKEKKRLEKITVKKIIWSRQHFLKLRFPTTYRHLIDNGIEQDWSLGYADEIGFRASTSLPFFWYDLQNETTTSLTVHSFQAMDVTLKEYLCLTPSEALPAVRNLQKNMQKTGGNFTTLWHNSSFDEDWKGWKEIYFQIFK